MSEKRFSATLSQEEIDIMPYVVSENDGEVFYKLDGVVDLLNEQQSTINELKEENDKLIQKNCIPCELVNLQTREIDKLKEENEQLRKELKEIKENPINYF